MNEDRRNGLFGWLGRQPRSTPASSVPSAASPQGPRVPLTAEEAWSEAEDYLGGVDRTGSLDQSALGGLSPEARMRAISVIAKAGESEVGVRERVLFEVQQLLGEGKRTLGELTADIKSMSAEGRQYARYLLTAHPEYRLKGLRWPDKPVRLEQSGRIGEGDRPSSYQTMADVVIANTEPKISEAISQIFESKVRAASHDWAGAAERIKTGIKLLDELPTRLPEPMLAVALFHQEAFLGQQGDSAGARDSIRRSIRLFADLCEIDDSYAPDLAAASQSYSYCLAELGELVEARKAITATVDILTGHLLMSKSPEVLPITSAYETKCEIEIRLGDLNAARDSRSAALQHLSRITSQERSQNSGLVEHLRSTLERKESRIG